MPSMLVTENLAELCALFIDDVYGELPSRIFSTLLTRGRSTLQQLAQHTSLTPRQLRHGLAILIQHNLLYYSVGNRSSTAYEANIIAAYNLIRAGKILELVATLHGEAAKEVMQSLLVLGNTKIGDLVDAYSARIAKLQPATEQGKHTGETLKINGDADHDDVGHEDDSAPNAYQDALSVESPEHLNSILCRLVEDELVDVVTHKSFQSFDDIHSDVQAEIEKKHWPQGVKGTKDKERYLQKVAERLREIRGEPKSLKRKLESNPVSFKRRRIENGSALNGFHHLPEAYISPTLDPDIVLRVNFEKCLVELRNRRLVEAASENIGGTTGQVYAVLLDLLTKKLSRCRLDPIIDEYKDADKYLEERDYVTTNEIFDHLSPSLDVGSGIGKVDSSKLDYHNVERIRRLPPKPKEAYAVGEDEGSDHDGEGIDGLEVEAEYDDELYKHSSHAGDQKGEEPAQIDERETKVKFKGQKEESRLSQMRQHLLLLCESTHRFLRHRGNGQWTVDFEPLVQTIREVELDTAIERKVGRQSLRLIRILRKHGKLDEKSLPQLAMMTKATVHKNMLEMQMQGFVDVQEVPKDNNRAAKTTIFLWFCDTQRSLDQLLDSTYKTMLRCLQVREVHRQNATEVLKFVQRPDVKGREQEALEKKYFDKYERYRGIEDKILGHVMRLDDLISVLRDY